MCHDIVGSNGAMAQSGNFQRQPLVRQGLGALKKTPESAVLGCIGGGIVNRSSKWENTSNFFSLGIVMKC